MPKVLGSYSKRYWAIAALALLSGLLFQNCSRYTGMGSSSAGDGSSNSAAPSNSTFSTTAQLPLAAGDAAIFVSPSGADTNAGTISSPFKSLIKAQEQVRAIRNQTSGNIVVFLRGGTHFLPSTLKFGAEDGGSDTKKVTYTSYPGEVATLSGGTELSTSAIGPNDFSALTSLPSNVYLKTPGQGLPRLARIPTRSQGHFYVTSFQKTGSGADCSIQSMNLTYMGGVPLASAFTDAELAGLWGAQAVLIRPFASTSAAVAQVAVDGSTLTVSFDPTEAKRLCGSYDDHFYPGQRVFFQGQTQFIKTAGDWAYDGARVLYHGESTATLIVPRLSSLISILGSPTAPVKNLVFSSLDLRDTDLGAPDWFTAGAIAIGYANNVHVERCHLFNLGGIGIKISGGSSKISILNNVIEDAGASGIYVYTLNVTDGNNPNQIASEVDIENNFIQNVGLDYPGHGIFAYSLANGIIRHNTIRYTGSIGIGRGNLSNDTHPDLTAENALIEANDVGFSMQIYDDGGGIYVAGKGTQGTLIKNNYIHDIVSLYPSGFFSVLRVGIYIDGLADSVTASDNLVQNSTNGIYVQTQISPDWRVRNSLIESYVDNVPVPLVYTGFSNEDGMRASLGAVGTTIHYAPFYLAFVAANAGVTAANRAQWSEVFARPNRFLQ